MRRVRAVACLKAKLIRPFLYENIKNISYIWFMSLIEIVEISRDDEHRDKVVQLNKIDHKANSNNFSTSYR